MAVKRYDGSAWQTVAGLGAQGAAATSSSIATWVKTASGGETSLSGNDDSSQALSYTVGQELVFINGTLLKRGSDYTATNGTSITGLTALAANDVATVWTVNAFSVTGAIANTIVDAKADLIVGTAADTPGRLAVGTDGQVLTADSTTGTGLKWAAASAPAFVGCKLTKSVDQTIINVTNTVISFDGEDFDTDGFHSNSTNNSRITIPTGKAGKYLFVISGNFTGAGTTGHLQTNMRKNGSAVAAGAANVYWKNQTDVIGFTMSHILDAAVGDYFEFVVYSNPGNNSGNITDTTRFSCQYLGA